METVERKYQALARRLDESALRLWAAVEARSLGRGGVSMVAKAAGMSRTTIHAGLAELEGKTTREALAGGAGGRRRIRAPGGGRKKLTTNDSTLLRDLNALVELCRRNPDSCRSEREWNLRACRSENRWGWSP